MPDAVDIRISRAPAATEVRVDPGQLGQALTNLALNGLRYSKEHTGRATLADRGGIDPTTDRPYLNVIDEGPGVSGRTSRRTCSSRSSRPSAPEPGSASTSRANCAKRIRHGLRTLAIQRGGSCFRITFAHPDRITA